jgi:DNA-binding transcriptional LysR family regulator
MNTDDLKLFATVMERGSFAAAARALDLDPSQVSRAVAALEGELGFRLFQRSTRKLSPTEAGAIYFERTRLVLSELEQAQVQAADTTGAPSGNMRITTSVAFGQRWLVPRVAGLRRAYPRLNLDLVLTDANVDLIAERIDLAIRLGPRVDSGFISTLLMPTSYRVVASPSYVRKVGRSSLKSPEQLANHDCVLLPLSGYRSLWLFRDRAHASGAVGEVHVHGNLTISTPLGVYHAVLDGLGPGLLADWVVADALASGELVELFPKLQFTATDFETAVRLMYPSRAYLPSKVRAVIDFLKGQVR